MSHIHILKTIPAMGLSHDPVAVDFETFYDDECSITKLGTWAYTHHPRFDPYLVTIVDGTQEFVGHPEDFDWTSLEGRLLVSHNRTFDYSVYLRLVELGWADLVDFAEWACSADLAAYMKGGRSLKNAVKNLLGGDVSKDIRKLMKGFTPEQMEDMIIVQKARSTKVVPKSEAPSFPGHDGRSMVDLVEDYALEDSRLCRRLWMDYHDQWPEFERRLSLMTGRQCIKGFTVDKPKLLEDVKVLRTAMDAAKARLPWSTELGDTDEGLLSIPKLNAAITALGLVPPPSTAEDSLEVQAWERDHPNCTLIADMRNYRKAGILIKRCQILADRCDPVEHRFQFAMRYHGADRTGRWAGGSSERSGGWDEAGFNVHNFPKEPLHGVDLRHRVIAAPGKKLIVADAAQIEPRCLAWLSGDLAKMDKMRDGTSVYQIHAVETMNHDPVTELKKVDKNKYALAKVRVLGLGYGCGHIKFRDFAASQYGYHMDLVESKRNVKDFRAKEKKITGLWNRLSFDFQESAGGDYEIELPSGRVLTYFDVQPHGHDWVARRTRGGKLMKYYGGLLAENLVQAVARDVFGYMQQNLEDEFGDVILFHVHDEAILEVDECITPREVEEVMGICPPWMAGLPVAAEAADSAFYMK